MQVEQRWEVAGDVDSPGSETGRVWVATFREGGGQGGRDESDTGEEGCTDVKMIEVVDEMVRGYDIGVLVNGPDWLQPPEHEDVGVRKGTVVSGHLLLD